MFKDGVAFNLLIWLPFIVIFLSKKIKKIKWPKIGNIIIYPLEYLYEKVLVNYFINYNSMLNIISCNMFVYNQIVIQVRI